MSSVSGKKLLIIAVVCGVLAATLGWLYLKAKEAQYRAAYTPVQQRMVEVIVPKADIAKAQPLTPANVAVMDVPSQYLPSNAVMANDWPKLENRLTTQALQSGRPITWDAVEQDGVSRFSENVNLGKRVKTVKVSKINSFDGMLRPGDKIDLLGTFSATSIGLQEQQNYSDQVVMTVLENVEVLAAGREDSAGRKYENFYDRSTPDGFNMNFSTLSLMLTPQQVARVELAEKAGELVAVLRNPNDTSSEKLAQITVSSLLDPLPPETVDVVLDADGKVVGTVVGDKVIDANGRIIGTVVDGQTIGLDGKVMGNIVSGLPADDPLLRVAERASVVRDEHGNIVGRVVDGKVVDTNGNVIGSYVDGKAVGLDGKELGTVQHNVALDAQGRPVDMSRSQMTNTKVVDGQVVVLDSEGNPISGDVLVHDADGKVIGTVKGDVVYDADGKAVGRVVNGQVVDNSGKVIADNVRFSVDDQSASQNQQQRRRDANRSIQFIPGGTGTAGVLPVQTLRLE